MRQAAMALRPKNLMWDNLQAGQRILKGMNAMERRKENKSRVTQ